MGGFHDGHAPAQSTVVHRGTRTPQARLGVKDFCRAEVVVTIEAAHGEDEPIHDGQADTAPSAVHRHHRLPLLRLRIVALARAQLGPLVPMR